MRQFILFLILISPLSSFAQDCDCTSNFEWAKETFEKNDAGYAFALEKKGRAAYDQHTATFAEKVSKITGSPECTQAIYEWLTFFRSGHLSIRSIAQGNNGGDASVSDEQIIDQFKDWEKVEVDVSAFKKYLEAKKEDDFEGVWLSGVYEIGIKKVDDGYLGFIIKADGVYWTENQVKLRIKNDNSATYYMQDHSGRNFTDAHLLGANYLKMGFITLERKNKRSETAPNIERYFAVMDASGPYFEEINATTVMLRIPSFSSNLRIEIDSVIHANRAKILSTPNLIVDIRNNGGGADRCYGELIPLLYTNPIRTVGVEYLSTPLNNQRMLDFMEDDSYNFTKDEKKWAKESYDKLSEQLGEFVMLNEFPISETTFDTVYPYPANVGIIINENNGSTAEQFLLAAKQSKKVKLFGTTTIGVLDVSNMYFVNSPCEDFKLGYSLSKSMRIPEMTIDDIGIQPDYYIHKSIPKYEWIEYVTEVLEE